jgi:protein SCO1/2
VNNTRLNYKVLLFITIALVMFSGAVLIYEQNKPPAYYGTVIDPPKPMPGFTLESVNGPVSSEEFRGKYVLLYFGYISCPDVCPVTLATITQALSKLDSGKADDFQVIFVSVDYKRDPPDISDAYAKRFNPGFIGLGGTQAQIDRVTQDYGIYYRLNPPDPATGFYSVDHTAVVMILNRNGELVLTWPFDMEVSQKISDLETLASK